VFCKYHWYKDAGMHKLSLFLITLLWVFSVHIRAQLPENLIKQGLSLDSAGKYKEAIAVFGKVIEMEPKLPVAWYNRGVSRLHAKQYSLAVVDFNKCIFMDTGIIEAYFNRFLAYKFTQNYQFALSDISHYIKRFPEDKVARAQRFLLAEEMEEWSLAISDKKWQLQHDFDFVKNESRNQNQLLSSLYLKAGSYDSALYFINKAIPAQPDNWTLLYERAGILQKMAEYQKSNDDINRILLNEAIPEPATAELKHLKADNFFFLKDYTNAKGLYIDLLQRDSTDASVMADYGHCLLQLEKYTEADIILTRAIKMKNDAPAYAYLGRGLARLKTGRGGEACIDWEKSYKLGEKSAKKYLEYYCKP